MSGRRRWSDNCQLAVLDAVVFFSAAVLVSSMIFYYGLEASGEPALRETVQDPSEVLEVVLSASIGASIRVPLDPPVFVRETDTVGSCIMAEAAAIRDGQGMSPFAGVNTKICEILRSVCGPCVIPRLFVLDAADPENVVLELPGQMGECAYARASSIEFTAGGSRFLVELELRPASPWTPAL